MESPSTNGKSGDSRIWITWETQRRNEWLANSFGCDYSRLDFSDRSPVIRYLVSALKTLLLVHTKRPKIVFCQCPSVVLVLLCTILKCFYRFHLIVDAHNGAIEQLRSQSVLARMLKKTFVLADMVIVSNEVLTTELRALRIKAMMLPDRLPILSSNAESSALLPAITESSRPWIVLISTFARDEPIEEFLNGVAGAKVDFTLFVTGRISKAGFLLNHQGSNVVFTDFLSQDSYDWLLQQSEVIVDLTLRPDCLVCGAYEAMAARKPMILSDSPANRAMFKYGVVFCDNTVGGSRESIEQVIGDMDRLKLEIPLQIEFHRAIWEDGFQRIERVCQEFSAS